MRASAVSALRSLFVFRPLGRIICWRAARSCRKVAITFDDGPTRHATAKVLEILKDNNVHCTFFMLGREAVQCPDLLERVRDEGHEIAVHGFDHTANDIRGQIIRCEDILRQHGVTTRLFRPAHGRRGLRQLPWIRRKGYRTVLWSFDAMDSVRHEKKDRRLVSYENIMPGDIILMHDDNPICVSELETVIESIRRRECDPVTVSELLG